MKRIALLALILSVCAIGYARTLTGALEIRVRSNLSDVTTFGTVADNLDYVAQNFFQAGEIHGAIDQIYRADRVVGTASTDVLGLVGSLTNAIGETVSFATVKALYVGEVSGLATLSVTGLATATLPPYGSIALVGPYTVASISDQISINATATTTYRVWIVGAQ